MGCLWAPFSGGESRRQGLKEKRRQLEERFVAESFDLAEVELEGWAEPGDPCSAPTVVNTRVLVVLPNTLSTRSAWVFSASIDPPKQRPGPCQQDHGVDRLGDVIVSAGFEPNDLVDIGISRGENENGSVEYLAKFPAYREAVGSRQHQVE